MNRRPVVNDVDRVAFVHWRSQKLGSLSTGIGSEPGCAGRVVNSGCTGWESRNVPDTPVGFTLGERCGIGGPGLLEELV